MTPIDYARSYLLGTWEKNEVRFVVESRTRITDTASGHAEEFIACASCKSEDTFAPADLFYPDNYDFLPIFGPSRGLVFRRKASLNPDYRSVMPDTDMWGGCIRRLPEVPEARELATPESILEAAHGFAPIVAQTAIENASTGLQAVIEYPVKTMNTRRNPLAYQADTGPVAYPDLAATVDRFVDRLSLAFVAFNAPHFADFVIESPTESVDRDGTRVCIHHFSRRVSHPARNRLYALPA